MRRKITKQSIKEFTYTGEDGGQQFLWDEGDGAIKGFGVRVTKSVKTFVFEGRIHKQTKRRTIGRVTTWTVDQARSRARDLAVMFDLGVDPRKQAEDAAHASKTIGAIFDEYMNDRTLKSRTRSDYCTYMVKYFDQWKELPAAKLTGDAVLTHYKEIAAKHGDTQANISFRMLRAILNHAMASDPPIITDNPVKIIRSRRAWKPEKDRKDYLRTSEIGPFLQAVARWNGVATRSFLEFLLCTGCRTSEASNLKWKDLHVQGRSLTFRDTKNTRDPDRTIPMTARVMKIIATLRRQRDSDNPFVFGAVGRQGQFIGVRDARKCLNYANLAASSEVTQHGLRRTTTTVLANDVHAPSSIYKRILGHSIRGDVTERFYRQVDTETLRPWMDALDTFLTKSATEAEPSPSSRLAFYSRK